MENVQVNIDHILTKGTLEAGPNADDNSQSSSVISASLNRVAMSAYTTEVRELPA